jgi:hypothetical protein
MNLARSRSEEARLVERAKIILACLGGKRNDEVSREVGVRPNTVGLWRKRFAVGGMAGLRDQPRPGKKPRYGEELRRRILRQLELPPPGLAGVGRRHTGCSARRFGRRGLAGIAQRRHSVAPASLVVKGIVVAVAEGGLRSEVREYGRIANTPAALDRLIRKLGRQGVRLRFCYEAGPCGYGIQRHLSARGHECVVVAPSLIPKRAGDRVKTDRRDAAGLARLHRAGELTAVWVPDAQHEAMRDLVRARLDAVHALRRARQQLSGFLLRQGCH